ncbi:MAG: D-alanine--D-alanine ligase family protein [Parcubacteria group bacterium]
MIENKKQLIIGVFFGSRSPEHEVSIITGQLVISELKKLGYNVQPIYIDKNGRWFSDERLGYLKFFTDSNFETQLNKLDSRLIDLDAKNNKLVLRNKNLFSKEIKIDIAFPAFHGMNGEDGTIQGLFDLCNIPYIGCEVACSAITIDKIITKQLYKSENIATTSFVHFTAEEWSKNKNSITERVRKIQWPVFVKPARLGSSIGIAKAHNDEELVNACEVAFHYDNRVIIEESVEDLTDITCAVIGNNDPAPSLVQESVFRGEHFSYESKYLEDGGIQLGNAQKNIIIPARLSEQKTREVRDMAVKIFKLFNCAGIARIDFLYDKKSDKVYANEINTMPGTLYHHLWKASGMEIGVVLEKLLELALQRYQEKNTVTLTFKSDILSHANSIKLQIKKEF